MFYAERTRVAINLRWCLLPSSRSKLDSSDLEFIPFRCVRLGAITYFPGENRLFPGGGFVKKLRAEGSWLRDGRETRKPQD